MPSFESINYAVRPNKNVERKLIAEYLSALEKKFKISEYVYLGLGGMWFVDFILFHKILSIDTMYSIEKPEYADRASFNKPFKCVEVLPGDSTNILREWNWTGKHYLVWLDYDTGVDRINDILSDIEIVCQNATSGSILIVTVNASPTRLPEKNESEEKIDKQEALRLLVGDLAPPDLKGDITKKSFPPLLSDILFKKAKSSMISAGREERFSPICNFYYRDTAPMITLTGMITSESDKALLEQLHMKEKFDYIRGEDQYVIDVPPLTSKEKIELDCLLPSVTPLSQRDIQKIGLYLKQNQIDSYCRFYKYYPVYAEIDL